MGVRCRIYGERGLGRKIVYILRKSNVYVEANECISTADLTGNALSKYYVLLFSAKDNVAL